MGSVPKTLAIFPNAPCELIKDEHCDIKYKSMKPLLDRFPLTTLEAIFSPRYGTIFKSTHRASSEKRKMWQADISLKWL